MSRSVDSEAVNSGRNADQGDFRDNRYVRCGRCGFINNLDQAPRAPFGSRVGQGLTHPVGALPVSAATNDFTRVSGCGFCGVYTYNQEERNSNG